MNLSPRQRDLLLMLLKKDRERLQQPHYVYNGETRKWCLEDDERAVVSLALLDVKEMIDQLEKEKL